MTAYDIFEIRWHGRGGQGVVTAAKIIALAALIENKFGVAQPFFGAERRGAPVMAFNRISKRKIRIKSMVYNPDMVVVVDKSLLNIVNIFSGLKKDGSVIINTKEKPKISNKYNVFYLDATGIAMDLNLRIAGIPLANMPMLGAVSKVSNIVSLESVKKAVRTEIKQMVDENIKAVEEGWRRVIKYG